MKTSKDNCNCSNYKELLIKQYRENASNAWSVRERQKWESKIEKLQNNS